MLTAHKISKTYDFKTILDHVSFSLNPGDRVGLIGPNGCGKTTLVKILAGVETPDRGQVTLSPTNLRIGYLAQGFGAAGAQSLGELLEAARGNPSRLAEELANLASALAADPEDQKLQQAYDRLLVQLETRDPEQEARQTDILRALGLAHFSAETPLSQLSGGQKTRLGLALALLKDPQVLLLDEPTNHLDIPMLEWLENWLIGYTSRQTTAVLIISHDRTFLDRTVTRILDLDPLTHRVEEYAGNYTNYITQANAERDRLWSAYQDQVYEIRRLKQDIARTKQQSLQVELSTTSRQPGVRRYAKKVARKAKSREKKLERYLASDERVEKPKPGWQMKLEFEQQNHLGRDVLSLEDLSIGYPGYPPLMSGLSAHIRSGERVVLTGANGCGKTTLLRTIAGVLPSQGGSLRLGSSVRLGYMAQEQELINPQWSAVETIQNLAPLGETETRSFLHYFLFSGDDALRPAAELSYGERARLSLACLVAQGCNFLLLDEPINHLDIPSRERFEQALAGFQGAILAVVHDRYFIQRFASRVWLMEQGALVERQLE